MGRLVDIDEVCRAIEKEWDGYCGTYPVKVIVDDTIRAVEQVEEVEAIPVPWITKHMRSLKSGTFADPAWIIKTMLEEWKEEQKHETD